MRVDGSRFWTHGYRRRYGMANLQERAFGSAGGIAQTTASSQ
jgi:hypothetical protein